MRRQNDLSSMLTFGGRVPASVGAIVALMVLATVVAAVDRRLVSLAALVPAAVWPGFQLWRLATWPFIQDNVLSLLFGGYMIWSVGQQLSYTWSERRFVARIAGWTVGAGAGTVLVAQISDWASVPYIGIWPVALAMLVAWAMVFPDQQTSFWGVLPMTGRTLALIAAGLTVLSGLMNGGVRGIGTVAPHLVAMGIAWTQARAGAGGGRSWRQAKRWWADREAKRRSRHLKVVKKNGSDGRSDWLN